MREKFEFPLAYIQTLREYESKFSISSGTYANAKLPNVIMQKVMEHMEALMQTEIENVYDDLHGEGLATEQIDLWLEEDTRYEFRVIFCPHCNGGILVENSITDWKYDCKQCGRGWDIDKNGNWHSIGATDSEVLTPKDIEQAQKYWRKEFGVK